MKIIELTQGQVALVSDHRYEELNQWGWYAKWDEDTQGYYAVRNVGKSPHQRQVHMSRQILNTPKGMIADHINRNTLDNQDHNLRNVTRSQNAMNRKLHANNKLGERNIRVTPFGTFAVQVTAMGVKHTKTVKSLDDAVRFRDEKRQDLHGEFACRRGCA